jgi:hypothetical protein
VHVEEKIARGRLTMSSLRVVVKVDHIRTSYFSEQTVAAPTAQKSDGKTAARAQDKGMHTFEPF